MQAAAMRGHAKEPIGSWGSAGAMVLVHTCRKMVCSRLSLATSREPAAGSHAQRQPSGQPAMQTALASG